nr:PREDICTED: Usher syndrome type-1C protein-binding protein 1 [Latimeria chalumnae]|eukprot:XP_006001684.2 PREDICTED: Usher syndrome type-1C protein-binding protein 1 [Latimeria chalumnae]
MEQDTESQCDPDPIVSDLDDSDSQDQDGWTMLRYEEHITELLVIITELNRKIDQLQNKTIREEDDYLDQCSELTISQSRLNSESQHVGIDQAEYPTWDCETLTNMVPIEDNSSDLSIELQRVLTALEKTVHERKNRTLNFSNEDGEKYMAHLSAAKEQWGHAVQTLQEVEREFGITFCSGLPPEEQNQWEKERNSFKEKNSALRAFIKEKDEELTRSKVTLSTFQEERDKLQRRVKELQCSLQRFEDFPQVTPSHCSSFSGVISPPGSTELSHDIEGLVAKDPFTLAGNLIRCLQSCPGIQNLYQLFQQPRYITSEDRTKNFETEVDRLQRCIDQLKCQNDFLLVMLERHKNDSEKLSMLLGKHESNSTALQLALQYSEECIDAYDVLSSLAEIKRDGLKHQINTAAYAAIKAGITEKPQTIESKRNMMITEAKRLLKEPDPATDTVTCKDEAKEEKTQSSQKRTSDSDHVELSDNIEKHLKEHIRKLKQDQAAVKITILELGGKQGSLKNDMTTHNNEVAAADDGVVMPGHDLALKTQTPKMEKTQLLLDLMAIREEMLEVKAQIRLTEKEKRGLEISLYTQRAQETACLLLIESLKSEQNEWTGSNLCTLSSASSTAGNNSRPEDFKEGTKGKSEESHTFNQSQVVYEIINAQARKKSLKVQLQEIMASLEKETKTCMLQKKQSRELITDLLKAHSNLATAYKNAKKKYEDQMKKLEVQVAMMSERHTTQVNTLKETAMKLQIPGHPC